MRPAPDASAKTLLGLIVTILMLLSQGCKGPASAQAQDSSEPRRIVLVQSYWNNYLWGILIEMGVLRSLGFPEHIAPNAPRIVDGIGVKEYAARRMGEVYELKILYMDTKRRPDEEWKELAGERVLACIREFSPDVAILADDNAQAYVGRKIAGKIPIVFCGVNAEYTTYYPPGIEVTGLHERMNYVGSFGLLRDLCPQVKRVVYLTDATATSEPEAKRISNEQLPLPVTAVHVCRGFEDYRQKVTEYQESPDVALAIFNLNFANTSQEHAIAWTMEHSSIPEVTFQRNTVGGGLLCASIISGEAHGRLAGKLALRILDGEKASTIPVSTPPHGKNIMNLVRAERLGLNITTPPDRGIEVLTFATSLHACPGVPAQ